MFNKMQIPSVVGGIDKQVLTPPTNAQSTAATDANPFYINGDFSKVKMLYADGNYSTNGGYQYFGAGIIDDIVLGQTYKVKLGQYSTDASCYFVRNITVYADKIKIGSCLRTLDGGSTWVTTYVGQNYANINHLYVYG